MNATFVQRILALWEESLERVHSHKRLIETRIADRAADRLVEPPPHDENQRMRGGATLVTPNVMNIEEIR